MLPLIIKQMFFWVFQYYFLLRFPVYKESEVKCQMQKFDCISHKRRSGSANRMGFGKKVVHVYSGASGIKP